MVVTTRAWAMSALAALAAGLTACSIPTKMFTGGGGGGGDAGGDGPATSDGRSADARMTDGPTGPFACIGQPFPTTTNAPTITISGVVNNGANNTPAPGIQVQVLRSDGSIASTTQTDVNGVFMVGLQTGGMAQDVSLFLMDPFGVDQRTYYYPSRPLTSDLLDLQLALYDQQTVQQIYSAGGVPYLNSGSLIFADIVDCNGVGAPNATVQEVQGPANRGVRYLRNNTIDPTAQATDASGGAMVFGQPGGTAVYSAQMPAGTAHAYPYSIGNQASVLYVTIQP